MNYGFMRRISKERFKDSEREENRIYPLIAFPGSVTYDEVDKACCFSKGWWPEGTIYTKKGGIFLVVGICTKPRWFKRLHKDIATSGGRFVFEKPTFVDKLIKQLERETRQKAGTKGR